MLRLAVEFLKVFGFMFFFLPSFFSKLIRGFSCLVDSGRAFEGWFLRLRAASLGQTVSIQGAISRNK